MHQKCSTGLPSLRARPHVHTLTERFSVLLQTVLHNPRTVRRVHIRLGEERWRCSVYRIQSDTNYIQSVRRLHVGVREWSCSVLKVITIYYVNIAVIQSS